WERRAFLDVLSHLADRGPADEPLAALVVYGLRADFYGRCANYPPLRSALQSSQVLVGPMSVDELREAILFPARDVGLEIESGLVELLWGDLGVAAGSYEAGRLPLLAHALRTTWQQRQGHVLTVDGYRTTGGIHRAVAATADRVLAGFDAAGQDVARALFLRL